MSSGINKKGYKVHCFAHRVIIYVHWIKTCQNR